MESVTTNLIEEDPNSLAFRKRNNAIIFIFLCLIISLSLILASSLFYIMHDISDSEQPPFSPAVRAYYSVASYTPSSLDMFMEIVSIKSDADPNLIFTLSLQAAAEDLDITVAQFILPNADTEQAYKNCSSSLLRDGSDQIRRALAAAQVVETLSGEERSEMMKWLVAAEENLKSCISDLWRGESTAVSDVRDKVVRVTAYVRSGREFLTQHDVVMRRFRSEIDDWRRNGVLKNLVILCLSASYLCFLVCILRVICRFVGIKAPPLGSPSTSSSSTHQPDQNKHSMVTRSKNGVFKPKLYLTQSSLPAEPNNVTEALESPSWFAAMQEEFYALKKNNTWTLVPPSSDLKLISNKWVFKVKTKQDGSLDKLKARLVARGFEQLAGVDYLETFSPVVKSSTIRLVFSVAATRNWSVQQIDVNNAFLNGVLEDNIYMIQPTGFVDEKHPNYVCKLNKALYGLKQAPRAWYDKLRSFLRTLGFERSASDFSLFFRRRSGALTLILIYVDDILITGDNNDDTLSLISLLNSQFALKSLGEVNYFLGIEVYKKNGSFLLCQSKYLQELLRKTNMLNCKACSTPMTPATKLTKSDGLLFVDPTLYRSTIGGLQYLTLTRPDIAFCVNKLSQFLQAPTVHHWNACKRLLRYLKGTSYLTLSFHPTSLYLESFADADWASCPDDRRSTGGHCIFLGSNLLVWSSKKQEVVSRSSAESEYRSLANATADIIWLQSLCSELGIAISSPFKLWCDNTSAVALASNPVFHARTKHIEVDVHYVREKVSDKTIEVGFVPSNDQIADIFTKPLSESRFLFLRNKLKLQKWDPG